MRWARCLDHIRRFLNDTHIYIRRSDPSIHLGRRSVFQRLMQPPLVVEPEVRRQPALQLRHRLVFPQVHVFVFRTPPQVFDEHVVQAPAPPNASRSKAAGRALTSARSADRASIRLGRIARAGIEGGPVRVGMKPSVGMPKELAPLSMNWTLLPVTIAEIPRSTFAAFYPGDEQAARGALPSRTRPNRKERVPSGSRSPVGPSQPR